MSDHSATTQEKLDQICALSQHASINAGYLRNREWRGTDDTVECRRRSAEYDEQVAEIKRLAAEL